MSNWEQIETYMAMLNSINYETKYDKQKTAKQHEIIDHLHGNNPILSLLFNLSLIAKRVGYKITRGRYSCKLCQPHTSSPED